MLGIIKRNFIYLTEDVPMLYYARVWLGAI